MTTCGVASAFVYRLLGWREEERAIHAVELLRGVVAVERRERQRREHFVEFLVVLEPAEQAVFDRLGARRDGGDSCRRF
ncbi:hypothetical protein ACFQH3_05345 [Haladaptatus sp. GCM10025707]